LPLRPSSKRGCCAASTAKHRRVGDLEGGNVRIETLVSHATADAIMAKLSAGWDLER